VAARLSDLGAGRIDIVGSLKADAPLLPVNDADFVTFTRATQNRPIFLAASTHAGEEEILCDVLALLQAEWPNLLLVVAPRHPERGEAIAALAERRGLQSARRAETALPHARTNVYIADTMGELGLFYRAVPFAFLGGSLVPHGGQNPLEAAKL